MLHATHIHKTYPGTVEVLKGLNLTALAGESIAITGKSGSGKSTLLSILAGFESPDSGSISLLGQDIHAKSQNHLDQLRSKDIGMIFQQFHLITVLTALENVQIRLEGIGLSGGEAREQAIKLLDRVGLKNRMSHLPHELSGGEQQRVAIARAVAPNPKLLFADEPSGNLDQESAALVEDLLFQEVKKANATLILITHDMDLASRCSKILKLHMGQLS